MNHSFPESRGKKKNKLVALGKPPSPPEDLFSCLDKTGNLDFLRGRGRHTKYIGLEDWNILVVEIERG